MAWYTSSWIYTIFRAFLFQQSVSTHRIGINIIDAVSIVAKMQQVSCFLITFPLILIRSD